MPVGPAVMLRLWLFLNVKVCPARTSCGSPSIVTVPEPERTTMMTSRSLFTCSPVPPFAGHASRVAFKIVRLRAPERAFAVPREQIDHWRAWVDASCLEIQPAEHLRRHDLFDEREELAFLEPDVGFQQLGELPHS